MRCLKQFLLAQLKPTLLISAPPALRFAARSIFDSCNTKKQGRWSAHDLYRQPQNGWSSSRVFGFTASQAPIQQSLAEGDLEGTVCQPECRERGWECPWLCNSEIQQWGAHLLRSVYIFFCTVVLDVFTVVLISFVLWNSKKHKMIVVTKLMPQ